MFFQIIFILFIVSVFVAGKAFDGQPVALTEYRLIDGRGEPLPAKIQVV